MTLAAEHLTCSYGGRPVLRDVSVRLEPGQILGLTGPSGTGKTTLARLLTGLQIPDGGRVTVDGRPVTTRRGRMDGAVGLLHQSPRAATDPRMTLRAIITQPSSRRGGTAATDPAARAGLAPDLLERRPFQVSDGQLQLACIARALAARPRYLVCDEPTARLDAVATASVAVLLRELADDGMGVLTISHDHPLLTALCDDVLALRDLSPAGAAREQTGPDRDVPVPPARSR